MNTILIDSSDNIVQENRELVLSNKIMPDIMWGKHIEGVTIQIDTSEHVRDYLESIQQKLILIEPDILLLPRQYQHISVNQIVFWGGTYKEGFEKTWNNIEREFLEKFQLLNNKISSFTITWNRVIPTKSAIILLGVDEHDEMNNLRELLFAKLPFPKETIKKNTIIHTTVARYKQKFRNPKRLVRCLDAMQPILYMKPEALIIRKENVYPSIDTLEISRIYLKNK